MVTKISWTKLLEMILTQLRDSVEISVYLMVLD